MADLLGGLVTVEARHLTIHEDEVVGVLGGEFNGLLAIDGERYGEPQAFERTEHELLVDGIVFDEEYVGLEVWGGCWV